MDCFYTKFSYRCTNFTPLLMQGEDRSPGEVGTEALSEDGFLIQTVRL